MSVLRPAEPLKPLEPGLYVVSTPIGNLGDLSFRALDVLTRCDCVLAEDTRVAAKLLTAYGVKNRVERYDDHAEMERTLSICGRLEAGDRIALISDAGTPLVSDPGFRLVRAAAERALRIIPVPGASAALAALAISGLPTDRFLFAGFTPAKPQARRAFLDELADQRCTLIFYETGPRLRASLVDMAAVFGPFPNSPRMRALMARKARSWWLSAPRPPRRPAPGTWIAPFSRLWAASAPRRRRLRWPAPSTRPSGRFTPGRLRSRTGPSGMEAREGSRRRGPRC